MTTEMIFEIAVKLALGLYVFTHMVVLTIGFTLHYRPTLQFWVLLAISPTFVYVSIAWDIARVILSAVSVMFYVLAGLVKVVVLSKADQITTTLRSITEMHITQAINEADATLRNQVKAMNKQQQQQSQKQRQVLKENELLRQVLNELMTGQLTQQEVRSWYGGLLKSSNNQQQQGGKKNKQQQGQQNQQNQQHNQGGGKKQQQGHQHNQHKQQQGQHNNGWNNNGWPQQPSMPQYQPQFNNGGNNGNNQWNGWPQQFDANAYVVNDASYDDGADEVSLNFNGDNIWVR